MCECNGGTFSDHDIFSEEETCVQVSISAGQDEFCCNLTNFLEVEGRVTICIIGIIFNTIALVLLFDKKLSKEIFNRLLLCLVMMDNAYLLIGVLEAWINGMEIPTFGHLYFYFYFVRPLRGLIMCSIIYTTIILAVQRYIYITRPLDARIRNEQHFGATWLKVLKYVGPVVLLSGIFQLPVFFEVSTQKYIIEKDEGLANKTVILLSEKVESHGTYDIVTKLIISDLRSNELYELFYLNIANIIVTGVVPLLMLAYFNFFISRGMKKFVRKRSFRRQESFSKENKRDSQEEKEFRNQRNQTIILFSIVIIFLLCHSLRIILNVQDLATHQGMFENLDTNCRFGHPFWVNISHPISETFLKLNSCFNFFIYCAFNNRFRKVAHDRLLKLFSICGVGNCLTEPSGSPCPRSCTSQDQKHSNTHETE